jgi:hypothetical protein
MLLSDEGPVSGIPWTVRSPDRAYSVITQEWQGAVLHEIATVSQKQLGRGFDNL